MRRIFGQSGGGEAGERTSTPSSGPRGGAGSAAAAETMEARLGRVFDSLRGAGSSGSSDPSDSEEASPLGPERLGALIESLGVNPETDVEALVVLYKCGARSMYELTREEFVRGMMAMGASSVPELKERLPRVAREVLSTSAEFRPFYQFVFLCAREGQARIVPKELAVGLWPIVLKTGDAEPSRARHVDQFCAWLARTPSVKQITRDQWNSFLEFNARVNSDFSNFAAEQSWAPVLFEEFVATVTAGGVPDKGSGGTRGT